LAISYGIAFPSPTVTDVDEISLTSRSIYPMALISEVGAVISKGPLYSKTLPGFGSDPSKVYFITAPVLLSWSQ